MLKSLITSAAILAATSVSAQDASKDAIMTFLTNLGGVYVIDDACEFGMKMDQFNTLFGTVAQLAMDAGATEAEITVAAVGEAEAVRQVIRDYGKVASCTVFQGTIVETIGQDFANTLFPYGFKV